MNTSSLTQPAYKNIGVYIDQNIRNLQSFKLIIEATSLLASTVQYEETLSKLAYLIVPQFADWCSIHLVDNERNTKEIISAHIDPKKIKFAKKLQEKYPSDPDAPHGVTNVIKTGVAEMMHEIPEKLLHSVAKNKEHLTLIRTLGLRSYMCVPLLARGKTLGAITCVSAESGRLYTEEDLAVVEDIARIAAISVDNALLFREAQNEIKKREKVEEQLRIVNRELEFNVKERTRQLENEIQEKEKLNIELRRSNSELEDFAYVASHDLQEPLRKIQSFGNLLKDEFNADYLSRMLDAAGRMRVLIDDILMFSRVRTKALPFEKVNLNTIATEVLTDLDVQQRQAGGHIEIDTLPEIEADYLQMKQVFQNLISNGLKFHKKNEKPHIRIYSMRTDGTSHIYFEDNGIGFEEKYKDKIFTIFERLHGRNEFDGTGIGLAVVKRIVDRHFGTIDVKSTPGKGATFIISLPVLQQQKGGVLNG